MNLRQTFGLIVFAFLVACSDDEDTLSITDQLTAHTWVQSDPLFEVEALTFDQTGAHEILLPSLASAIPDTISGTYAWDGSLLMLTNQRILSIPREVDGTLVLIDSLVSFTCTWQINSIGADSLAIEDVTEGIDRGCFTLSRNLNFIPR